MVKITELKKGQRIKLLTPLVNNNSKWKPVEDIPVGTLGTVVWPCDSGAPTDFINVGVRWDNGSCLGLLTHDAVQVIDENV